MDNEKFGKFIKELRIKNNMTQKELGEKIHITDKAISKWERGLSVPDISVLNSISKIFNVSTDELINGELVKKDIVDIEKVVNETIENITKTKEKRENRIKNTLKIISIILFIIFVSIQIMYLFIMKGRGYEYISNSIFYIINEVLIISLGLILVLIIKKSKAKNIYVILGVILSIINITFFINNDLNIKSTISFSKNFSNMVILKQDKETGELIYCKDTKFLLFTKEKQRLNSETNGNIKTKWIASDICSITYEDIKGNLKEFVATYGDRGYGNYYYVASSLYGKWEVFNTKSSTKLIANSRGITINKKGKTEFFEYDECEQFGTIAIVLYKNKIPKYVIGLNEDCKVEDTIIKKGGTITLMEITIEKRKPEVLECITYKDDNLEDYSIIDLDKNEFKIQDGILYISYDGKEIIEAPGNFDINNSNNYNEYNFQVSEEKTIFPYIVNDKKYLVYSNDMGKTWETVEIENNSSIEVIQFVTSNVGYILEFYDVAMGNAFGKIKKTIDGGKSWNEVSNGIGEEENKTFKRESKIKFINETVGFVSMPSTSGESCEVYITKNSGETFEKLNISESKIYDFYNLPTYNNGFLEIKISQGTDGDYNGGDFKLFRSEDMGETWY